MGQEYSKAEREHDEHALPDREVFYQGEGGECIGEFDLEDGPLAPGFYWWSCFPGCMPDSDPIGPFATYAEALADAHECACGR